VCVHAVKEKQLQLSTPNLVLIYCMEGAQHALTLRLKGQKSRSLGAAGPCRFDITV